MARRTLTPDQWAGWSMADGTMEAEALPRSESLPSRTTYAAYWNGTLLGYLAGRTEGRSRCYTYTTDRHEAGFGNLTFHARTLAQAANDLLFAAQHGQEH